MKIRIAQKKDIEQVWNIEKIKLEQKYGLTKGKDFVWMDIALTDNFKRG